MTRTVYLVAEAVRQRGYRPAYRQGEHCPGCGCAAWHVGRYSAECARCATALPLAPRSGPSQ